MKKVRTCLLISLLLLSFFVVLYRVEPAQAAGIERVWGYEKFTATTGTGMVCEITNDLTQGDYLIMYIGYIATGPMQIDNPPTYGPTQDGVNWTLLESGYFHYSTTPIYHMGAAMWIGYINSTEADNTLTWFWSWNLGAGVLGNCIVLINEYHGIDALPECTVEDDLGGATSSYAYTGATDMTTSENELWIGGTLLQIRAQTNPTNDFTMLDGSLTAGRGGVGAGLSLALLENIVDYTGNANCTTTAVGGNGRYIGVMCCFMQGNYLSASEESVVGYENGVSSDFSCYWEAQGMTLSGYIFQIQYGEEADWANDTWTEFDDTNNCWANLSKVLMGTELGQEVSYQWYANGSDGSWWTSATGNFTLQATVTFYFEESFGVVRRNGTDISNNTQTTYYEPTVLDMGCLPNSTYAFLSWNWTNSVDSSTDNPMRSWEVINQTTLVCYMELAEGGGGAEFIFSSFTWSPANPDPYEVTDFDASASNSSSSITAYQWDFGDGNETEVYTDSIDHYWEANDTYTVSLTVVSDVGEVSYSTYVIVGGSGGGTTGAGEGDMIMLVASGSLLTAVIVGAASFIFFRRREE